MKKILVTHDGVCHTDEVLASVVLTTLFGVNYNDIIRTRDKKKLAEYDADPNCIVYDVGNGELNHHSSSRFEDGRELSSIGLVWRKYKDMILDKFMIDEISWKTIDRTFIAPIDASDNGGDLNPFNYAINAYKEMYNGVHSTFVATCLFMYGIFTNIINSEMKKTSEREAVYGLREITINGKHFRISDTFHSVGRVLPGVDGLITKVYNDTIHKYTYKFTMLNGGLASNTDVHSDDIVFVHKSGFCGEVAKLRELKNII